MPNPYGRMPTKSFNSNIIEALINGIQSDTDLNTTNTTSSGRWDGNTWIGVFEQNDFAHVGVSLQTDESGTLYFDFSPDGDTSHVNTFPTNGFNVSAGVHEFHTAVKLKRYFRVRFVGNGGRTYFRLYTYFSNNLVPISAPLNQPLGLDADALMTRTTFPWLDVSRGLVSGMSSVKKFGRNGAVGTSYVPICFGGNYRTPQSSAATTLRIKAGGSANDTAAGSGAREVTLEGLDENFAFATEAIATAGASASSPTTTTFTRLFRAYVSASGTYATQIAGSHAAAITIEDGAGTQDWAVIDATNFPKAQSEIGVYSVPAGYTAYVFLDDVTIDTTKTSDLVFFHRGGVDETSPPYTAMRAKSVLIGLKDQIQLGGRVVPFGPFTGPCDFGFLGKVDVGTASIGVEFEIILINET